jgi:putative PIN family toxin of toxin-antitoxin system
MERLVIDTNVFISYLISTKGHSYKIVNDYFLEGHCVHFISTTTSDEYLDVFSRTRFAKKYPAFAELAFDLLCDIIELSEMVQPTVHFDLLNDKDDNAFLDVAFAANADYLVTGNTSDFTLTEFYKTIITSPTLFCAIKGI